MSEIITQNAADNNLQKMDIVPDNQSFGLTPKTLDEAIKYSEIIASSSLAPKNFIGKPNDILVAVQMGAELGLSPMQAIQNIAVINGRPSLWGDAVIALVRASPLCEYVTETFDAQKNIATCATKRKGEHQETVRTFSFEDAKTAGLLGKGGPWTQYPKRMTQMRARGFALRDAYADVLRGLSVAEEQQDTEHHQKMKHITPQDNNKKIATSKTDALLEQLEPEASNAELDHVIALFTDASTPEELQAASKIAEQLPCEEQLNIARTAYKQRANELKAARQKRVS